MIKFFETLKFKIVCETLEEAAEDLENLRKKGKIRIFVNTTNEEGRIISGEIELITEV